MKIRYEVTMDDMLTFYRHYYANSEIVRRRSIVAAGIFSLGFLIPAATLDLGLDREAQLIWAVVSTTFCFIMFQSIHKRSWKRSVERLLREAKKNGSLGPHELEILPDRLTDKTEAHETSHPWAEFDRIEESGEHLALYSTPLQVHIVPKNNMLSGDIDRFIEQANAALNSAQDQSQSTNTGI